MLLQKEKLKHLNSITHEGKVVVLATDAEGQIYYTIKQDGFEDSYLNTPADQRTGWEEWKLLEFPNEENDKSVVEKETEEFTRQDNNEFLLCSRYKTQNESAVAPVQLVSGLGHIYVFRQSKDNTLFVDRFVLDGMTNELTRKLEVRFKRSRQKYKPTEEMKIGASVLQNLKYQPIKNMKMGASGLQNLDSLDYRDTNNEFFYEPTTELKCINNLQNGWFSVVQVPTNEHDKYRWHIFAYNNVTKKVQLTTIRTSDEGLFDIKDYTVLEPQSDTDDTLIPRSIPGIIQRTLNINGITVTNGLAATQYNIQQEQETSEGPQLMKTFTKVMLAVPTNQGTAALSFGIAGDGTLAKIDETRQNDVLRSKQRDVLLPLNTLEEIKILGDTTPPPQGTITGFSVGTEEDGAEDLVKITSPETVNLADGEMVEIQNTTDYNGLYNATKIDKDTFTIELSANEKMGNWETVEEEGGLIFDGMVTAYEKTADGKLKVTASNHGLENGDEVLLTGTQEYDNTYQIQKIDDNNFAIQRQWAQGEAVNIKLESRKRRGMVFDGVNDYIELPPESFPTGNQVTVSFWAKGASSLPKNTVVLFAIDEAKPDDYREWIFNVNLPWSNGSIYFDCCGGRISKPAQANDYKDQWNHWAFTKNAATGEMKIYLNGKWWHQGTGFNKPLTKATKLSLGKHSLKNDNYSGTIADLQIWDVARSEKEIKDTMYLQLTGKEVGLVGYWRLGGISEGKERKVLDFSVNGNHGIVHGDPYVGGVSLSRKLRDGTTLAVKYSNDDLFAVSQRATYIEEFEFKVDPAVNVNDADGNGNKIFQLSYWGKSSRSAEDTIAISVQQDDFESLGSGWHRASCRFNIPDGVAMLRTFEIANVRGTWNTLGIRKHHIRMVSDAITEAKYSDECSLDTLTDNYASLVENLQQLEQKEREEAKLLQEKQDLEEKLALLEDLDLLRAKIQVLEANIEHLKNEKQASESNYNQQLNSPFNYYCYIRNEHSRHKGWQYVYGLGMGFAYCMTANNDHVQQWKFVTTGQTGVYYIQSRHSGYQCQYIPLSSHVACEPANSGYRLQQWKFVATGRVNVYYIQSYSSGLQCEYFTYIAQSDYPVACGLANGSSYQQWYLQSTNEQTNNNISNALQALNSKIEELKTAETELTKLKDILNIGEANKNAWLQQLNNVIVQLSQIQTEINSLNTTFLNAVSTTQQTPQTMQQLSEDGNGLATQGAMLGFVHPASRLNTIETCEGNVQLSYFDDQGQMRQTLYDATSDSLNTAFEQWIPDSLRTCLNFNNSSSVVKLNNPIYFLGENFTVEAWFAYPFGEKLQWHVLASSQDREQQIVVYNSKYLGLRLNGVFFDCGYDLEKLSTGWHHLAIVTKQSQQSNIFGHFYIDGEKVGETKYKPALRLDGQNDYISLPPMDIDYSVGFTIEAWVHYANFNTWSRFIDFGNGPGQGDIVFGNRENTDILFVAIGSSSIQAPGVLETKQWMHLAATVDNWGNAIIYKDGFPVAKGKLSVPSYINRISNFIGKSNWPNDGNWDGEIAEVRLWNLARTQTEIQANLGKTITGDETGLVGYWRFAGGSYSDSSPKGYNGTIKGSPKFISLPSKITGDIYTIGNVVSESDSYSSSNAETSRQIKMALEFDGTKDYVEVPYSSTLNTKEFTISFWVKLTQGTGDMSTGNMWVLSSYTRSARRGYIFTVRNDTNWNFLLGIGDGWGSCVAISNVALNTWTHLCVTLQGNNLKFYVNGKVEVDTTVSSFLLNTTDPLHIGASTTERSPKEYFHGAVAEVQIWNKARTQEEIQGGINKTLTGNEPGLAGYWPLRDGSAKDYSVNGNNGTIHGSPKTVPFGSDSGSSNNTALQFDGTSYIEFPKGLPSVKTAITIEFWSKGASPLSATTTLIEGHNSQNTRVLNIHLPWANKIYWDAGNPYDRIDKQVEANEYKDIWVHWAFVKDSSTGQMLIYRNGEIWLEGSGNTKSLSGIEKFVIGAYVDTSNKWSGSLGEFRIWNKARTQEEIQGGMNKTLTGNEPGLAGYWPLRDGSGKDYSPSLNNGIIKGSPKTVTFDKVKVSNQNNHQFGKLAEVRIWDMGLSDEEIAVNSKTLLSGNEPGLLAYYPMNTPTGNEVRDYSGNNRHGSMEGASWWGCAAPIGNLGHSVMQFDGKNDYVDVKLNEPETEITHEFWFKTNSSDCGLFAVVAGNLGANGNDRHLYLSNGNIKARIWRDETISSSDLNLADNSWHHIAHVFGASVSGQKIYIDGQPVANGSKSSSNFSNQDSILLGYSNDATNKYFQGQMAEVRIWKKARTQEEIQATMYQSLTGKEADLLGYWPLKTITSQGTTIQTPDLTGNYPGTVHEAITVKDNTLPIGGDALVSSEYSTITIDPGTLGKSAIMRRFFASPVLNGAELLPEKRIEKLILQWIGNAQFAPTLLGYIEGAPPIPSENLTESDDYNGATSVELAMSEDVEFNWSRAQDAGLGASIELFAGFASEAAGGLGVMKKIFEGRAGFKGALDFSYQFINESSITSSSSNSMIDSLELRGTPEKTPKFPHLGTRFIPKNVGYALVISSLADVFISKLARSGKMVGYQVLPVDGIPPDVNTITFLMNPAYTMNGSLDGMTGSSAASDRFFRHVPEMRSQYGSLYPASYYRLQEAYNLKQTIEREDKRRESYFQQFNARLLDEASLRRETYSGAAPSSISVEREEQTNTNMTEEEQKAAEEARTDQMKEEIEASKDQQSAAVKQKQAEIDAKIDDQEKRTHATESFASWQKKMENILIRSGKRNIVNNYVWDADGGLRAEAQSFANTAEHTIGGSFALSAGLGVDAMFMLGAQIELTALATVNMTQTMTKTEARSKGIELNVDLSGVESIGITDSDDYPIIPGEKVDRYRFMSFYLENSTNNFYDFFNYVVDPEWLRSNDEEARALRQAMGKANKTWRVLHRVTYVERPALMGFGRDLRKLVGQEDEFTQRLYSKVEKLEQENQGMKQQLDQIMQYLEDIKGKLG